MQVETFEALETDCEGNVECDAEAVALIEKLGLGGQQKLINRTESAGGTTVTRNPYRVMTADENFVYKTLCPASCKIADYGDGPIPLRVLQVAAHADEHFDSLLVWAATSSVVKDPVLIGVRREVVPPRTWEEERLFILARWGDVLEPFEKLLEKATAMFRKNYAHKASELIAKFKAAALEVEHCPAGELFTKSMPSGYV